MSRHLLLREVNNVLLYSITRRDNNVTLYRITRVVTMSCHLVLQQDQ